MLSVSAALLFGGLGLLGMLAVMALWLLAERVLGQRARALRGGRLLLAPGLLGLVLLAAGIGLLAGHAPERLRALLGGEAGRPEVLLGELAGATFRPDSAELIDGVLTLREGSVLRPLRELRIEGLRADDAGLQLQARDGLVLRLAWWDAREAVLRTQRLNDGYRLRLALQAQPPNRLVGQLYLDGPGVQLDGMLVVYRDGLRYRQGQVDTRHNSPQTLAWVIRQYLQQRLNRPQLTLAPLPPLPLDVMQLQVPVTIELEGHKQTLQLILQRDPLQGWQVLEDDLPASPEVPGDPPDVSAGTPQTLEMPDKAPI